MEEKMKQKNIRIAFTIILLLVFYDTVSNAFPKPEECLVMGNHSNPATGMKFFKQAMEMKMRGQTTEAIDLYEKAIIADNAVLKYDDYGLAKLLLEKYRNMKGPHTTAFLCKKAFLENIVAGNLDKSINLYKKAINVASTSYVANIASAEEKRLIKEKKYIEKWVNSVQRANEYKRKQDLAYYLKKNKVEEIQSEITDNSNEIEKLNERLKYLRKKEKEVSDKMYSALRISRRERRRYYYPSYYANAASAANPPYKPSRTTSLDRSYAFQSIAKQHQIELAQIRAEISGVERRIAQAKKAGKSLRKKLIKQK